MSTTTTKIAAARVKTRNDQHGLEDAESQVTERELTLCRTVRDGVMEYFVLADDISSVRVVTNNLTQRNRIMVIPASPLCRRIDYTDCDSLNDALIHFLIRDLQALDYVDDYGTRVRQTVSNLELFAC